MSPATVIKWHRERKEDPEDRLRATKMVDFHLARLHNMRHSGILIIAYGSHPASL